MLKSIHIAFLTIICSMYIIGGALHFINQDVKILTLLNLC